MNLTTAQLTMTSREMAELTETRHDNVKRTIETLANRGVITLPQIEEVSNTGPGPKTISEYRVGKRDSYVIVAQLSPEFTARLVDRWQELEAHAVPRVDVEGKPTAIDATKEFRALYGIARLIGLDKNVAAISANQATTKLTGKTSCGFWIKPTWKPRTKPSCTSPRLSWANTLMSVARSST